MIKAILARGRGRSLVFLGLSEMNVVRLREGQPIYIDGRELGLDHDIAIHYGPTEEQIEAELTEKIGQPAQRRRFQGPRDH